MQLLLLMLLLSVWLSQFTLVVIIFCVSCRLSSRKKGKRAILHALMAFFFQSQILEVCGQREITRRRREEKEKKKTLTVHYLLLPAIITRFPKLFLSPFLGPWLYLFFHFANLKK